MTRKITKEKETQKALSEIYAALAVDCRGTGKRPYLKKTIDACFKPRDPLSDEYYSRDEWNTRSELLKAYLDKNHPSISQSTDVITAEIAFALFHMLHLQLYRPICTYDYRPKVKDNILDFNEDFKNIRCLPDEDTCVTMAECFEKLTKDLKECWEIGHPEKSKFYALHEKINKLFQMDAKPSVEEFVDPVKSSKQWEPICDGVQKFLKENDIFKDEKKLKFFDSTVCAALYWLFHANENKILCPYPLPTEGTVGSYL